MESTNGYTYNIIQFSSFVNNTANPEVYSLLRYAEHFNFYMCNILKNNAYEIFMTFGNLRVYDCCILDNECTYLVFLSATNYNAYFYNCTCQNSTSNSQGNIRTYSIPSSSFLHALDLLQTAYCIAEYDYLDDLKPYIPIDKKINKNDEIEILNNNKKLKRRIFY